MRGGTFEGYFMSHYEHGRMIAANYTEKVVVVLQQGIEMQNGVKNFLMIQGLIKPVLQTGSKATNWYVLPFCCLINKQSSVDSNK